MKYSRTITDKFLNSSFLASSLFVTSGCHKTYKDYKNAPNEYKDKFLVKDCLILSGAALGMLGYHSASNKLYKPSNLILKDFLSGILASASGILGALAMDCLYSKCNKDELEYKPVHNEKNKMSAFLDENLAKVTDKDTRSALYSSVSDLPIISSGMLGANAIEIAQNKKFSQKLKHSTGYLVNDTLIPLIFLSVSSALTKNLKPIIRIPAVFLSLFTGTLVTRKIFDKISK